MKVRRGLALAVLGVGAGLAAFALATLPGPRRLLEPLELTTLDLRTRMASHPPRERSDVVLVLFDSASVEGWPYLSPFPRAVIADLIDAASAGGARAIGLDVHLDRLYPELEIFGEGDARLRASIQRSGNVILGAATTGAGPERSLLPPHPYFAEVAAGIGATDLPTPFETVRDAVLAVRTRDGMVPGFSLALYSLARGLDPRTPPPALDGALSIPGLPERYAQLSRESATLTKPILFVGPPSRPGREDGAFVALSASYAAFMPELFRDRVVLIGTGYHAEDAFRSPFYDHVDGEGRIFGWTYGVEVHANALENLLVGDHPVPLGTSRTLSLLIGLALLVVGATFARGPSWGAGSALLLLGGYGVAAVVLFDSRHLHLPVVQPVLALTFAFLGSTSYVSVVEGREKRMIRGAFAKYLSPAVVDQLVSDPSRLRLGGEKRIVSVLFSDLVGFTSLSESMEPERLLTLLNRYLDEMTNVVFAEGGTLDKYIGDAVMALYGAPHALDDHALRACRTALLMQRRLRELNREWAGGQWPELRMRIGINTGAPVIGNIGGEKRFDYTALGDAVNLAARLEPACKTYGVSIMIAEETRRAAGDAVLVRPLDLLAVYGKTEPIPVYELLALAGEEPELPSELLERYDRGIRAYRERDFAAAVQHFQAAAEISQDRPSLLYLERSRQHLAAPPPESWDLVERPLVK